jgi:NAD(P)-dependent dehydrogenase (short-subunit alcohol dehydrogenase family)
MIKKFYITGTRRGLGKALEAEYGNCDNLEDCDIFINCKHDGFEQVDLLYKAATAGKRIINIGSNSGDGNKRLPHKYAIEKAALDKANEQLYYQGVHTTVIRFGYFDSPRVSDIDAKKMSIDYCIGVIKWVIEQDHRVKDLTVCP